MNRSIACVLLLVAVLIGCKRKPRADDVQPADGGNVIQNEGDGEDQQAGGGQTQGGASDRDDGIPPWPPLPDVPNRTQKYPNTPGGRMAIALDNVADYLISHAPAATETPGSWENYCFHKAFEEGRKTIAEYPKSPIGKEKEWFAPAGDSGRERALLDRTFSRFLAATTCYWELERRWNIEKDLVFLRQVMPRRTKNKEIWAEATKTKPPSEEVVLNSRNLKTGSRWKYDLYRFEVKSEENAQWTAILFGGGRVAGRVEVAGEFKMTTALMSGVLSGSVGTELVIEAFGPCVLDLSEFKAPMVKVGVGEDLLIRVGPGIQSMEVSPKRGVILARGVPKLKVKYNPEPQRVVAIVNY